MRSKAFTLVELLIVVIILGILAAVVIPQFSDASTEARDSSLTTNLATIRGQIELYRLQHGGRYPEFAKFKDQMTGQTDKTGDTTGTGFGPYLQAIPKNPFDNLDSLVKDAADGAGGWFYNETTGAFGANDGDAAHQAL